MTAVAALRWSLIRLTDTVPEAASALTAATSAYLIHIAVLAMLRWHGCRLKVIAAEPSRDPRRSALAFIRIMTALYIQLHLFHIRHL